MQEEELRTVRKYLGSVAEENGELDKEVDQRTQVGWRKWKKLLAGCVIEE